MEYPLAAIAKMGSNEQKMLDVFNKEKAKLSKLRLLHSNLKTNWEALKFKNVSVENKIKLLDQEIVRAQQSVFGLESKLHQTVCETDTLRSRQLQVQFIDDSESKTREMDYKKIKQLNVQRQRIMDPEGGANTVGSNTNCIKLQEEIINLKAVIKKKEEFLNRAPDPKLQQEIQVLQKRNATFLYKLRNQLMTAQSQTRQHSTQVCRLKKEATEKENLLATLKEKQEAK